MRSHFSPPLGPPSCHTCHSLFVSRRSPRSQCLGQWERRSTLVTRHLSVVTRRALLTDHYWHARFRASANYVPAGRETGPTCYSLEKSADFLFGPERGGFSEAQ